MTIPLNDGFTVVLNRQTGQATYSADADTFSSEIDVFSNQVNTQSTEMNATAIEVNQASVAAVGSANYKGLWSLATGAASKGESFLHENVVWALNVDLADITLSEPSSVNGDWRAIDSSSYQYAVSQLANGDFSKVAVIYAGLVIDTYDYAVYQDDGRIYAVEGVTGTFSNPLDFNPVTGIDSGLSGAIRNINSKGNLSTEQYARFENRQAVDGGTATSGSKLIATLNHEEVNTIDGASLASNKVTLPAGNYKVKGIQSLYQTQVGQAMLYDVTNAAVLAYGNSIRSSNVDAVSSVSTFSHTFNLLVSTEIAIYYQVTGTSAGAGLGVGSASFDTNIHAFLEVYKTN